MKRESTAFVPFLWTYHLRWVNRVLLHSILDLFRYNYLLRLFDLPRFRKCINFKFSNDAFWSIKLGIPAICSIEQDSSRWITYRGNSTSFNHRMICHWINRTWIKIVIQSTAVLLTIRVCDFLGRVYKQRVLHDRLVNWRVIIKSNWVRILIYRRGNDWSCRREMLIGVL